MGLVSLNKTTVVETQTSLLWFCNQRFKNKSQPSQQQMTIRLLVESSILVESFCLTEVAYYIRFLDFQAMLLLIIAPIKHHWTDYKCIAFLCFSAVF